MSISKSPKWHWQLWKDLPYLTCSLLQDWQHGFFSQQFYPRPPVDLAKVLHPQASAYRLKQVHGNRVLTPSEIDRAMHSGTLETEYPPADGALTEGENQSVWVASADCTPVLIGDVTTGRVAALHAGWRGTAQKIIPEAVSRLIEAGSRIGDLRFALGPAIAVEVYQVTEHVAAEVGASLVKKESADTPETILAALENLDNPPIHTDPQPGRVRLDLRRVNALQAEQLGVQPENIAIAPFCTYQHRDRFFSYRRTKEKKVQWSGIVH